MMGNPLKAKKLLHVVRNGKANDRFTDGEENVCIWSIMGMPMMVHSAMAKKTLLVVKDSDAAYGTFTDDKEDFFILSLI